MKKMFLILTTLTAALTGCNFGANNPQTQETNQSTDTVQKGKIHPIIENIFYDLPLEKSRLELREVIVTDKRFILTDTTFNNFKPSSFFKGITSDKGLIKSTPDSIQVMLIYGNASLTTEKGGQKDSTKHPMILEYQYFFSDKESAEMEYRRILNMVQPIFTDTSSIMEDKWETEYSMGKQKGTQKCIGKIFDNFEPYYRVAISSISYIPTDGFKPVFVLDIAFSKEDKKEEH
jgi:hypothetical protein